MLVAFAAEMGDLQRNPRAEAQEATGFGALPLCEKLHPRSRLSGSAAHKSQNLNLSDLQELSTRRDCQINFVRVPWKKSYPKTARNAKSAEKTTAGEEAHRIRIPCHGNICGRFCLGRWLEAENEEHEKCLKCQSRVSLK